VFLLALARRPHVDHQRRPLAWLGHPLRRDLRTEPLGGHRQVRTRFDAAKSVLEIPDDLIEADAPQSHGRFAFAPRVGDDHDRFLAAQYGAGPRRILSAEADVDASGQVSGRELGGIACIQYLGADRLKSEELIESHRVDVPQRLVERRPLLAVQHGIVSEIRRGVRLIGRDQIDERRFAHRLQRIVGAPLLADG
jgi:hypothetical protein